MSLSDNSKFGIKALTQAVNEIEPLPTQIRDLGIFTPQYLTTTYVDIENREGVLQLVKSKERGLTGEPVADKTRTQNAQNHHAPPARSAPWR